MITVGQLRHLIAEYDDNVAIVVVMPSGKLLQGESVEPVVMQQPNDSSDVVVAVGVLCGAIMARGAIPVKW